MKTIQRNLEKVLADIQESSEKALEDVGLDLQAKSVARAPLQFGDLRGSAHTTDVQRDSTGRWIAVSYGMDYALRMHEDLKYTPSHAGTGPKYLEKPLMENAEKYKQHIASSLKVK